MTTKNFANHKCKVHKVFIFYFITFYFITFNCFTQNDTLLNKKKLYLFSGISAATYTGTMLSLNQLWYKNYSHSSFHFFDDSKEWLQMDKFGHSFSSYYLSSILTNGFEWSKLNHNKSVIIGSGLAFLTMSSIEIFDGYSSKWGASLTDVTANFGGSLLYASQELAFKKQICRFKFSYHPTEWTKYRPDALGSNNFESILKDYNGQTYWLSCNLQDVTGVKKIPVWLNFALGYSGEAMLGGKNNFEGVINIKPPLPVRYRQYYFSLDADLSRIKTKSKILKTIFKTISFLKIPFPAIVLEKKHLGVKGIYF